MPDTPRNVADTLAQIEDLLEDGGGNTAAEVRTILRDFAVSVLNLLDGGTVGTTGGDPDTTPLTVQGADGQQANLFEAKSGALAASTEIFIGSNNGLIFTARANGPAGNAITVTFDDAGANPTPLSVSVVGNAITVHLQIDGGGPASTANQVLSALTASVPANALIATTLGSSSDGTDIIASGSTFTLEGGVAATTVLSLDTRGVATLQSLLGLGEFSLVFKDAAGDVVAHFDNDGGFGFANENFTSSEQGNVAINYDTGGDPLAGNPIFAFKVNGSNALAFQPGGGFAMMSVIGKVATDPVLELDAFTGQTADLLQLYDENYSKNAAFNARGDLTVGNAAGSDPDNPRLVVQGADGQIADVVKVRTGAIPAYYDTFGPGWLYPGDLRFTARTGGVGGNSITVEVLDPGANNQPLTVDVVGNAITVNLATNGGGAITSTGNEIIAAIEASGPAHALIRVELTGEDGDAPVSVPGEVFELAEGSAGGDVLVVDERGELTKPLSMRPVYQALALEIHGNDQTRPVLSVTDSGEIMRVAIAPAYVEVRDGAGDLAVRLSASGIETPSTIIAAGVGPNIHPTSSGGDGLYIDGENLVAADGAAMIRFIQPIGNMPEAFHENDGAVINMDLTDGAAALLIEAVTVGSGFGAPVDGDFVGVDIPLLPGHHLATRITSAPADGDLAASELAFWFDDSNGAAKLRLKGKSSDGTVVNPTPPSLVDLGVINAADLLTGPQTIYALNAGQYVQLLVDWFTAVPVAAGATAGLSVQAGTLTAIPPFSAGMGILVELHDTLPNTETWLKPATYISDGGDLKAVLNTVDGVNILAAPAAWQANNIYAANVIIDDGIGHWWWSGAGGTSDATPPDFAGNPSQFDTVVDNSVTWTNEGPIPTVGSAHFYAIVS